MTRATIHQGDSREILRQLEDVRFVGVELSPEYREIALARIAHAEQDLEARQRSLFDEIDKLVETVERTTQKQLGLFGG
jgi:DNA modification methylase